MLARYDQDMDRRSRTDVLEGNYGFVPVNNITFNLAFNNATEKTIAHQLSFSTPLRTFNPGHPHIGIAQRSLHLYLEGYALERGANADTLSRCWFEGRAVVGAHEVSAIQSKKLVIHPIPMWGHRFR
jgi:hypothetical protein